ncbi:hypothetical protein KM800_03505 [Clostridium tyrobutyricum]|uniref:hypothetical protein n=1 Tax=Clostridium tyrobutyricum TaxID=1519 RepID=UPI001C38853E|nr:hypothetical protein [Clostridium tyrobutyricum]MBV4418398.1 hypothetical protein [Clostridium tyrobutyricum]
MLKITLLDLLLRATPESFLFVISSYIFSHKKFAINSIIKSSVIMALSIYLIRLLPIQFGVHIILNMTVYIILLINVNKIEYKRGIEYALVLMAMLSTSELLNIVVVNILCEESFSMVIKNDIHKNIYFAPSLILFIVGIFSYNNLFCRHKRGGNFDVIGRTGIK